MNLEHYRLAIEEMDTLLLIAPGGWADEASSQKFHKLAQEIGMASDSNPYVERILKSVLHATDNLYSASKHKEYGGVLGAGVDCLANQIRSALECLRRWPEAEPELRGPQDG